MLKLNTILTLGFYYSRLQLFLLPIYIICFSSFSTTTVNSGFFSNFYQDFRLEIIENLGKESKFPYSGIKGLSPLTAPKHFLSDEHQTINYAESFSIWEELKDWWGDFWSTDEVEKKEDKYITILSNRSSRDIAVLSQLGYIDKIRTKPNGKEVNYQIMMEDCTDCPSIDLVLMCTPIFDRIS